MKTLSFLESSFNDFEALQKYVKNIEVFKT